MTTISKNQAPGRYLFFGLALWFVINFIQSFLTEISNDEAYYWMYANHLDWGYFDHPPMVALMIKLGSFFFPFELGVRFVTVLAQVATLFIVWKLTGEKDLSRRNMILFFGIAYSIIIFQLYGFITTPDAPLLFFTALFLFGYKRFLEKNSIQNIFWLMIGMAGLMYSKYHGALVIGFTVLANLRLLLNIRFWLAALMALILFIPHLAWQYHHDFPSFHYHLSGRLESFTLVNFLHFWPNQFIAFNPLVLGMMFFILFRYKPSAIFERTLIILIFGFFGFFWLISFREHIEPQWTAVLAIPMIILVFNASIRKESWRKYLYRFVFPSILLLALIRVMLIIDFIPLDLQFHGQRKWAEGIHEKAGNLPVVFLNSFQKPSVYSFYTGQTSFSLTNIFYRKTQYDIWNYEEQYQGKQVAFMFVPSDSLSATIPNRGDEPFSMFVEDHLQSLQKLEIVYDGKDPFNISEDQPNRIPVEIHNPYPYPVDLYNLQKPVSYSAVIHEHDKKRRIRAVLETPVTHLEKNQTIKNYFIFKTPLLEKGTYQLGFSVKIGYLPEAYNSPLYKVNMIN